MQQERQAVDDMRDSVIQETDIVNGVRLKSAKLEQKALYYYAFCA